MLYTDSVYLTKHNYTKAASYVYQSYSFEYTGHRFLDHVTYGSHVHQVSLGSGFHIVTFYTL